ncbi:serine hydrolase [Lacticaseibacillus pabuli]|uniref:Serine hydrolase n=1 Tax=Lacticaseibacillus pabuli TaxID=3025672 RepID=A0ABY7WVC4_9LACO|nr:serine hydrolase domain-containing protein [Lacticaseibacillus sp. KACC 23028]WDF82956.1 serine hydrolase [Lacticaseibacillus sp. KACC 23028]
MAGKNSADQNPNLKRALWQFGSVVLALAAFVIIGLFMRRNGAPQRPLPSIAAKTDSVAAERKRLTARLDDMRFSGTVLIVQGGRPHLAVSRGYADYPTRRKNTLRTAYEIDSLQKSLTAVLVMREVDRGRLSLTDHLSKFYPAVPGSQDITLRDMLDMKSGLSVKKFPLPKDATDKQVVQEYIHRLTYTRAMRGHWWYQPVNYNLLSGIIAQVTKMPYADELEHHVIKPLRLQHTHFAYLPDAEDATGYGWNAEQHQPNYTAPYHTTAIQKHFELGTGQLYMTPLDLYAAESAVVNGKLLGTYDSDILHRPGTPSHYGGGLYNGPQFMYGNGYGYGFSIFMRISKNGRDAVIVMSNTDDGTGQNKKLAAQLTQQYVN